MSAIEARGLTKRYGDTTAVDHLDLTIEPGEVFGLLGPNGAGKTTTILMLLGLTEPTDGSVTVDGLDPARSALDVKRVVGYLPDDVGFYDEMTGRENLRYTARLNRIPRREVEPLLDQLLTDVGLNEAADRKVRGYSRGMRQRLGLADALVKSPSILVLDEPTVNIDPEGVRDLLALVRRLRDERGTTVLLSSHLLQQVEEVCDRIGIFLSGSLVACGSVADLTAELDDDWTIELELAPSADADVDIAQLDLALLAMGIEGVVDVTWTDGRWLVHADRDVRLRLVDALADRGARVLHLRRRDAGLDAVYHRWFRESR